MKWLKRIGIALGVLVVVLAGVPFFISLDGYIPLIEKEASDRLKEPVKVGGLRAVGLPLPHVTVSGVTIGKAEDIKVGKITVTPDLWSLFAATKVIKSIEISNLVITQKAIDKIPVWTRADAKLAAPAEPPAVRVLSVKLDDALVNLQGAPFGPFDARLNLSGEGTLESASIVTRDGKLKALVKPDKSSYVINVTAKGWKTPVGPAIQFDELSIRGVATSSNANLTEVRARLYGGAVAGEATLSWQKGTQLRGTAEIAQVDIKPLLQALGKPATMSGKLTARPVFSANASRPEELLDALRLETPFDVRDGIVHGVDMLKAATFLIGKDGGRGGETRFDALSGHLAMDRGIRRLTQLNIVSGSLSAEGNVTISPKDELSGRLNTKVKAVSLTAATVALNVSGTLDSPFLYPSGGTVAGAAAGTAVLGPGLGTAVGARVGQWTEELLGKKEEKKKNN
jgi:uncharacterized protein involved in outer membrane biogenesis